MERLSPELEREDALGRQGEEQAGSEASRKAAAYDFRRPDRIAKDQLRSIHLLHDNFARSLASSMSAYLRAYVMVSLESVDQLSFLEFTHRMSSPTCIVGLGMRPYDGTAALEIDASLVFPILEMLLGGTNRAVGTKITREITEIEQSILEVVYRIILNDLMESWRPVTSISFGIESHETEPSMLRFMAPNEAMVAIRLEMRIGENTGKMNIGIPSIVIKMLRQKFDQGWTNRRTMATEEEQQKVLQLVKPSKVHLDARLEGPTVKLEDLLRLNVGDVLAFDYGVGRPVNCIVNGKVKYLGQIVAGSRSRGFRVDKLYHRLD